MPTCLGPYLLERRLGETYIWQARDQRSNQQAIVQVLPAFMDTEENEARFEREVEALKACDHPGLCRFIEQGTARVSDPELVGSRADEKGEARVLYYARDFIDGFPLHAAIRDGGLPLKNALEIAIAAASALEGLHSIGWIHRNISPRTVFLAADGTVRLFDFGLVRKLKEEDKSFRTSPGQVLGTAGYMAPEQFRGEELSMATDLFSFGVVLYQMIAGDRPFPISNLLSYISAIEAGQAFQPLAERVEGVPKEVDELVERLLAADPSDRLPSATELVAELERLAHGSDRGVAGIEIDRYRIEERMSQTLEFLATDTESDERVVLRLLPASVRTQDAVARFMRELSIERDLNHPRLTRYVDDGRAICPDIALGCPAGTQVFFLAREFVAGELLEDILLRGPIEVEMAVRITLQLTEALKVVHARDVLHRNIQPSTVLIEPNGSARLLDFSLAKIMGATEGFQTQPGKRIGAIGYMAPEIVNGHVPDRRADVFSLGALLYRMLIGETPFPTDSMLDYVSVLQSGQPAGQIIEHIPTVSPELNTLVARMIAFHREARPGNVEEVRAVLDFALASASIG